MDSESNFSATPSERFQARELNAFGARSRFGDPANTPMINPDWARDELIPFLKKVYGHSVAKDHNWNDDLSKAQFLEPQNMPDYPVHDAVFIERLRLALIAPELTTEGTRIANIAKDRMLTIRLFIRRSVMFEGSLQWLRLASLPSVVKPQLEDEVLVAEETDRQLTGLFTREQAMMSKQKHGI